MVVGQLERAGLITAAGPGREGRRPERTVYALTDAGRAELGDWLRELVAEPRHEYPHFVTALSLIGALGPTRSSSCSSDASSGSRAVRAETRAAIDETVAGGVHPLFLVEEEYRLALLDAERRVRRGLHRPHHRPRDRLAHAVGRDSTKQEAQHEPTHRGPRRRRRHRRSRDGARPATGGHRARRLRGARCAGRTRARSSPLATNGLAALRALGAEERVRERELRHAGDHPAHGVRAGGWARRAPAGRPAARTCSAPRSPARCTTRRCGRGSRSSTAGASSTSRTAGDGVRATFADGSEPTADVVIGCRRRRLDGPPAIVDPAAPAPRYARPAQRRAASHAASTPARRRARSR